MKAAKELLKEGIKETKIHFQFHFYFWVFIQLPCSKEITFWTVREQSFRPNKALKCTSHFRWLICPNSVFLAVGDKSIWCFWYKLLLQKWLLLVEGWASVLLSRHVVFPTSRREVGLSSPRGPNWSRTSFFLVSVNLFPACKVPTACQGCLGTFTFWTYFILWCKKYVFLFSSFFFKNYAVLFILSLFFSFFLFHHTFLW